MGGEYCVIGIPIYEVSEVGVHAKVSVSLEVCMYVQQMLSYVRVYFAWKLQRYKQRCYLQNGVIETQ